MLSAGNDQANFIALFPQTFISASDNNVCALLRDQGFLPGKIIAIASNATVTQPRKKMLLFAGRGIDPNAPIPVFFTQCDKDGTKLIVEKEYIQANSIKESIWDNHETAGFKKKKNKFIMDACTKIKSVSYFNFVFLFSKIVIVMDNNGDF